MPVEFTAQEMRNVFAGLDRSPQALEPFDVDDTVYLERDLAEKVFRVYGTEPDGLVEPLVEVGPDEQAAFGFINRYYMLRDGTFNPMENDEDS